MATTGPTSTEAYPDEYIGDQSVEACIVMTALATFFLSFRFYSKFALVGAPWGWEDTLLVGAYVFHEGLCVLGILLVRLAGVGYHIEWVELNEPSVLPTWAKYILAFEFAHFGAICLPKMAIVSFYLRIFQWRGRMLGASVAVQLLLVATWAASCAAAGLQCRPLASWWDPAPLPGAACIDIEAFFHAQSVASPVLDCLVIALPIPTICGLSLAPRKKMELIFIFSVGSFGIIASIIRAAVFFNTSPFADQTWASVELTKWGVIEVGTYITTACLPDLKPLLQRCSGRGPAPGGSVKLDSRRNDPRSRVAARAPAFDEEQLLPLPPTAPGKIHETSRARGPESERSPPAPASPGRARGWREPHNSLRSWCAPERGGGESGVAVTTETAVAREER